VGMITAEPRLFTAARRARGIRRELATCEQVLPVVPLFEYLQRRVRFYRSAR
jgi:hypothetical protein